MKMEQPYLASIHDSFADGIQFVENHVGLTESIEGSLQRPTKKKARFSRVLDMQIRIPILQPFSRTPPPSPGPRSPPPPVASSSLVLDSPSRSHLPPPPTASSTLVFDSPSRSPPPPSPPSHRTPAAPGSPLSPPPQVVPPFR